MSDNPMVLIETSMGDITLELLAEEAPKSVENFVTYVESNFYDNTVFHRVIPGFMIQGGGHTWTLAEKPGWDPIANEAGNGLKNERGTIAVARTEDPHSGANQFFINLVDNDELDHQDESPEGFGYAVFGRVIEGMEVVDEIAGVRTSPQKGLDDAPVKAVTIKSVIVV
jgi:cyclophilin family peptidyl-prolyl cis-trans isomerase